MPEKRKFLSFLMLVALGVVTPVFFLQVRNGKRTAVLAVVMSGRRRERLYSIYRPNTGLQQRAESLQEVKNKCKKVRSSVKYTFTAKFILVILYLLV